MAEQNEVFHWERRATFGKLHSGLAYRGSIGNVYVTFAKGEPLFFSEKKEFSHFSALIYIHYGTSKSSIVCIIHPS